MELVLFLQLFIIRPTLQYLEPEIPWSLAAEQLLLGTAAQESHLGHLTGGKRDLRMYQMEAATEKDIWINYLAFNSPLAVKVATLGDIDERYYAAALVRVHYWRTMRDGRETALFDIYNKTVDPARVWKKFYNTSKGKGTRRQFIDNYRRLVQGRLAIPLVRQSSSQASLSYVPDGLGLGSAGTR